MLRSSFHFICSSFIIKNWLVAFNRKVILVNDCCFISVSDSLHIIFTCSISFFTVVSCITVFRQRANSAKPEKTEKKRNRKWLSRLFPQHLAEKMTVGGKEIEKK